MGRQGVHMLAKTCSNSAYTLSLCCAGKMTEREDNVYMAKLSEQAERYDGMFWMPYYSFLPAETASLCGFLYCC